MTQSDKQTNDQAQDEATENRVEDNPNQHERKTESLSFWQTLVSVGQASFGVQNQKNKERDFEKGSIKGFVAAALIFTVIFVLALVVIVNLVLG